MDHAVSLWWQKGDQSFKHIAVIQPGATSGMTTYPGPSIAHVRENALLRYIVHSLSFFSAPGHRWVVSGQQTASAQPDGSLFGEFTVRMPNKLQVIFGAWFSAETSFVKQVRSQDAGRTRHFRIDGKGGSGSRKADL